LEAKFVKIDLGEMGQTKDGYAKELAIGHVKNKKKAMIKVRSQADLVTCSVFITKVNLFNAHIRGVKPCKFFHL